MLRLLAFLILFGAQFCRADVPVLFREEHFSSTTLAEAVNHYIAIGQTATLKEMDQIILAQASDTNWLFCRGFSVEERISWVCRILFVSNGPLPLRPPKFGALSIPEKTMPAKDWPLYPVVLSGSSYFVLSQGYNPDGQTPETIRHYLDYCAKNGTFRKTPILVPTKDSAMQDVAAIREIQQWKNIEWQDSEGFSYPMGEQLTYGYMQAQAKLVSK